MAKEFAATKWADVGHAPAYYEVVTFRRSIDLFHISAKEESNSTKRSILRIRHGQVFLWRVSLESDANSRLRAASEHDSESGNKDGFSNNRTDVLRQYSICFVNQPDLKG